MTELLRNAWTGCQEYKLAGKIAALFVIAVFYLLMRGEKEEQKRRFVLYGAVMGALCTVPFTAVFFMGYQTNFYDYGWIWSYVPMTAVTALAGTVFVTSLWEKHHQDKRALVLNGVITVIVAAFLVLSGDLSNESLVLQREKQEREDARRILQPVEESEGGSSYCLWAPGWIMQYAVTSQQPGATVLYGRNMWDVTLNAYSYDTYTPEEETLFLWMEKLAETGNWVQEYEDEAGIHVRDGSECIRTAVRLGADRILLPDNIPTEALLELREGELLPEGMQITKVGKFYLISVG